MLKESILYGKIIFLGKVKIVNLDANKKIRNREGNNSLASKPTINSRFQAQPFCALINCVFRMINNDVIVHLQQQSLAFNLFF